MAIAQTIAKVGVVFYDYGSGAGNMWLSCINMSLVDFYANHGHYKTRMVLHTRNSNGDVISAAAAGSSFLSFFLAMFYTVACLNICIEWRLR